MKADKKPIVLLAANGIDKSNLALLRKYATVYELNKLDDSHLQEILPIVNCLLVFSWPKQLSKDNLTSMVRLRFVQNILAGVNQIPFSQLKPNVIVSSNAGAYSIEVAEYAMSLVLAAAKQLVRSHNSIKEEPWSFQKTMETGKDVIVLENKVLGILGYGGIGSMVGKMARCFRMRVYAYSRRRIRDNSPIQFFYKKTGLRRLVRNSDVILLALPLTLETRGIIDDRLFKIMKKKAILVNIARGELVDQKALYKHLVKNPLFYYATDVWWYRKGRESLHTDYAFMTLPNFIGTPHLSGPSGYATGRPVRLAVENMVRYLTGLRPRNIVNRNDYVHRLTRNR